MHFKLLGLSLVTGMMSATAFAEPPIQPGDTLESLSKVKVSTTVNGQAGSIEELVSSGQIRIVDAVQTAAAANPAGSGTEMQTSAVAESTAPQAVPQSPDLNTAAQTADPATAQANTAAVDQTAQVSSESEHADSMQPNPELAAQQAEQVADQESAAAPVNQSAALAPADATAPQEAFAATPEATQPDDAVQAAPEADLTDAPVNAAPEAPMAETTEN